MRRCPAFITVALSCAVSVSAQNLTLLAEALPGFPACSLPAYYEALNNRSNFCSITNYYCQCILSRKEIEAQAGPKIIDACGTEAADFQEAYYALCEGVELPTATSRRPTVPIFKPVSVPSLPSGWRSMYIPPTIPTKPPTIRVPTPFRTSPASRTSQLVSITESSDLRSTTATTEPGSTQSTSASIPTTRAMTSVSVQTTSQPASLTLSSATSNSPITESPGQSPAPGFSKGTKAGIGVGVGVVALLFSLVALLICRRRRRKMSPPLQVLGIPRADGGEEWEKAELEGSEPKGWSRFGLARKPELEAVERKNAEVIVGGGVAELGDRGRADGLVELDGRVNYPVELGSTVEPSGENNLSAEPEDLPLPSSLTGPPPAASELYPTPQTTSSSATATEEERNLECHARRLQAERKRLAEREEQIALEEEALRRKKAMKAGNGG